MMIEAGFSTRDITPAAGSVIPGGFSPRLSTGTLDPLQATVCVIRNQKHTAAVIGVDMVSLACVTADRIRANVAADTGISEQDIIVAASHTHGGGPSNDVLGSEADEGYLSLCVSRIGEAAIEAYEKLQPVTCAHASGDFEGWAFNRRFKMRDGSEASQPSKGNPEIVMPAGPVDPELGVIAFRTRNGTPLGAIASFACHPTVIWGNTFTGDFPAYWRSSLREKLHPDFEFVFLNGACGDIAQIDFANPNVREGGIDWARDMGEALANKTLCLIESVDYAESVNLITVHGMTRVEYRHPTETALESARSLIASDSPWNSKKWQARDVVLLAEELGQTRDVACRVDMIGIGSAIIAAAPWQPFCEFGLSIKAGAPDRLILLAAFANGMLGYVPTRAAFRGGGYEPTLCRGSKLAPDAGEKIVAESIRLLNKLQDLQQAGQHPTLQ